MRYFERILDRIHLSRGFWLFFVLLAGFVITGFVIHLFYIDILLGFIAITIGLVGLLYELTTRSLKKEMKRIYTNFRNISEWLDINHSFVKRIARTHEQRFHNFDRKRAEMEQRFAKESRGLARKIIEMENTLNTASRKIIREREFLNKLDKTAKALLRERKLMLKSFFQLSDRQTKTLGIIKEQGKINTKSYRQKFRVPTDKARKELEELKARGLLKKRGRGAGTYYILGF